MPLRHSDFRHSRKTGNPRPNAHITHASSPAQPPVIPAKPETPGPAPTSPMPPALHPPPSSFPRKRESTACAHVPMPPALHNPPPSFPRKRESTALRPIDAPSTPTPPLHENLRRRSPPSPWRRHNQRIMGKPPRMGQPTAGIIVPTTHQLMLQTHGGYAWLAVPT